MEDLAAERGLDVSYETVRRWVLKSSFPVTVCAQSRTAAILPEAPPCGEVFGMVLKNLSPICHAAGAYFADDPGPPGGARAARGPHRITCRYRDGPRCPRQGGSYDARRERRLYRRAAVLRAPRSRAHARRVTAFPVQFFAAALFDAAAARCPANGRIGDNSAPSRNRHAIDDESD